MHANKINALYDKHYETAPNPNPKLWQLRSYTESNNFLSSLTEVISFEKLTHL